MDKPEESQFKNPKKPYSKPTKAEQAVLDAGFEQLKVYWGPAFRFDETGSMVPTESSKHWYLYRDGDLVVRGGTVRLNDRTEHSPMIGWSHGANPFSQTLLQKAEHRGGTALLSRLQREFISDNPKLFEEVKIPQPKVLVEDKGGVRRDLWFLADGQVVGNYLLLRDGREKAGSLSWAIRKPALQTLFLDLSKVGKALNQVASLTGPLGFGLGNIFPTEKVEALKRFAGKLEKAQATAEKLIASIDDEKRKTLSKVMLESGLDETISPESLLTLISVIAELDLPLPME